MPVTDDLATRRRRAIAAGTPIAPEWRVDLPPTPDLSAWDGSTSPTATEAAELVAWIAAVRTLLIDLGIGVD